MASQGRDPIADSLGLDVGLITLNSCNAQAVDAA